ncbi:MAG: DUF5803 family protein [Methanomicrobiales archaeon]|nr:DUF5803 family protein [Methanomicrobiales archaeon]
MLCAALVILSCGAGARTADYWVAENGSSYHAEVTVELTEEYMWWELGLLGERIPITPENVTLRSNESSCNPCPFNVPSPNRITFSRGNYTVGFDSRIRDNHILTEFEEPTDVRVVLPPPFDVRNPLLGTISSGGVAVERANGSVEVRWNETQYIEARFYDPFRETLLTSFFTFWGVIAVVLLLPFLLMRRQRRG